MPRILIIGATGYIDQTLATSLLRSGAHKVFVIVRSASKANDLAKVDVTPILCPDLFADASSLLSALVKHNIVVVVACCADSEAKTVLDVVVKASKARLEKYDEEGVLGRQRLGFIFTSGTWVYGSCITPVSDLDFVGSSTPPSLVAWRPAQERAVLAARHT